MLAPLHSPCAKAAVINFKATSLCLLWMCTQVAVIDLDFKAVSKIPRHAALDAEVLAAAAEHTDLLDKVLHLDSQAELSD